jgi:general secretion pathway protein K
MSQSGAEDADYESLPKPYLAANAPMINISELRLVNGFSPQWIEQLKPYLCAIPQYTTLKINVNTVTEENAVILAAMTGVPLADMQALVASRTPDGFQTPADFFADPRVANANIDPNRQPWFDVKTEYFQLRTKTQYNNATFNMLTVFKVDNNTASVVKREFGGAG